MMSRARLGCEDEEYDLWNRGRDPIPWPMEGFERLRAAYQGSSHFRGGNQ